jgi:membrane-bound serine protease (ClpP class)
MLTLGLMLLVLGAALAVAEAHVPSFGALGTAAIVSLAVGVTLVFTAAGSAALVALFAGLGVALVGGTTVWVMARKALATRRLQASNSLVGRVGVARTEDSVFVDGALWRARMWEVEDGHRLARGEPVVVEHVNGLTLTVRPAEEWEVAP